MIMKYRASHFLAACFWKDEDVPLILSVKKTYSPKKLLKKRKFSILYFYTVTYGLLSQKSQSPQMG